MFKKAIVVLALLASSMVGWEHRYDAPRPLLDLHIIARNSTPTQFASMMLTGLFPQVGVGFPIPRSTRNPFDVETHRSDFSIDVRWYGAKCDTSTDDTTAIRAAVDWPGAHEVRIPRGLCRTTSEMVISQPRVNIRGEGKQVSRINFVPTVGGTAAFHFTTGINAVLYQNSISDLTILSTNTTLQKFMILATDTSELRIENIATGPGVTGGAAIAPFTGASSIGIKLQGREFTIIRNATISADIPLWIDDNPNSTIDVDHLHVQDFYGAAQGTNPVVYVSSGVNATDVTFDGYQGWITGARGIYWVDTTSVQLSHNIRFANVRYEQPTARFFIFDIQNNVQIQDLIFDNVLLGGGLAMDGFRLRKVDTAIFNSCRYNGIGVALDVDSTVNTIDMRGFFTQDNSTISTGTLVRTEGLTYTNGLSPNMRFEHWDAPGSLYVSGRCQFFMGLWRCAGTGTIANGAQVPFPTLGGAIKQGRIEVYATGATKHEHMWVMVDPTGAYKSSGTANTAAGPAGVGGTISVLFAAPSAMVLFNNLGESVEYTYDITQRSTTGL